MRHCIALALLLCVAHCRPAQGYRSFGDEPTLAILGPAGIGCAAVAVSPRLAVTANHCAPDRIVRFTTASPKSEASRVAQGVVVARDPSSDLAVFAAAGLVPAELAREPLDLDRVTTMIAHVPEPWGAVAIRPSEAEDGFLRSGRLHVGTSGSGLWDADWRLVGVAVGNDDHSGYFAGVRRIAAFLHGAPLDRARSDATPTRELRSRLEERVHASPDARVDVPRVLAEASEKRRRIARDLALISEQKQTRPSAPLAP